jgi:hypothetical protein
MTALRPSDRRRARRFCADAVRSFSGDYLLAFMTSASRLPVGLVIGAAGQAPRACNSARGLTG